MMDISDKLKQLIEELAGKSLDGMTLWTSFYGDLGFDDLDCLELLMSVEKAFGINIPDCQAEKFLTFGDLLSYVQVSLVTGG